MHAGCQAQGQLRHGADWEMASQVLMRKHVGAIGQMVTLGPGYMPLHVKGMDVAIGLTT